MLTLNAFESRFKDREYIGSGGFAKVYKAFDHAQNRYVALKVADVRPEWKHFTLQREVELVNKLQQHPNIARYDACYRFDMGVAGEIDFAILKFYEDGNLEQFLKSRKLTEEDQRVIIKGILMGVAYLHSNNYIHRDLKAQNILLQREDGVWSPKITDFGLSRMANSDHTGSNSSIGLSYAYAAPEQIQNKRISKKVDLWAVGVIIYRILTGELPFRIEGVSENSMRSQLELSRKIVNLELPEKLGSIPEPYQRMIRACLVIDPQYRAASAEVLIDLLDGNDGLVGNSPLEELLETEYISANEVNPLDATVLLHQESKDERTGTAFDPTKIVYEGNAEPITTNNYGSPHDLQAPVDVPSWNNPSGVPENVVPMGYKPPADWVEPEIVQTEPPVEVKKAVKVKAGSGRSFSLLWFIIPGILLVIFAIWGIYSFTKSKAKQPEESNPVTENPTFIPEKTYAELFDEQLLIISNSDFDGLDRLHDEWLNYIPFYNDCRWPYGLALNLVVQQRNDEAKDYLRDAAQKSIDQQNAQWLLKNLEAESNGLFKDFKRSNVKAWQQIITALKQKDATNLK